MIYLNAEVASGLGEDTFWTWMHREFPSSSFTVPKRLNDEDAILRYSTLGFLPIKGKQIALCWELYPEMRKVFKTTQWDHKCAMVEDTARYSTYRTVATAFSRNYYEKYGSVEVIPIGVDIEVFKPSDRKEELRKKYGLPLDKEIGLWIGTTHPMKGYDALVQYARENPHIHWIVIWKWEMEAGNLVGAHNYVKIPQTMIAELMNAADFFASCSRLPTYYMAEWEAMACNIPFRFLTDTAKEFTPCPTPRDDIMNMGWDRPSVKKTWQEFLARRGVKW